MANNLALSIDEIRSREPEGYDLNKIKCRFLAKVLLPENDDNCWNWNGFVRSKKTPYGRFIVSKTYVSAHRMAYYLYYGTDPCKLHVLHTCDNPRCVNPKHLFLGTNDDNVKDKVKKGRHTINCGVKKGTKNAKLAGSLNSSAKFTEKQVIDIRKEYIPNIITKRYLSQKYNVHISTIDHIIERKSWVHI